MHLTPEQIQQLVDYLVFSAPLTQELGTLLRHTHACDVCAEAVEDECVKAEEKKKQQ